MARTLEIPLEPLTHAAFAPFGQLVGERPETPGWQRPLLDAWKNRFEIDGRTELRVMRYHFQGKAPVFHLVERHVCVTESRIPMAGAQAVIVVGPLTADRTGPPPETLRAFHIDGRCGLMLHRGTWHALDCFALTKPHADFAFVSEVETEDEIETSKDPIDGERTHLFDYRAAHGVEFRLIDPKGLAPDL